MKNYSNLHVFYNYVGMNNILYLWCGLYVFFIYMSVKKQNPVSKKKHF